MNEKLIGLEDLPDNFKVVKTENNFVYLKLYKGQYTIKVELPLRPTKELASLFGHILGDGCIKRKEENVYYTNKSKELIEEFKSIIKELFGIEPRENFNEMRKFYESYPPKTVAKFLVLCGFPKGEKTKQILIVPDWIKIGSNEIKSAFIRALFDDEGTVINSKGNRIISFGMNKEIALLDSHKIFIEDIRKIISDLEIYPNMAFERKQPENSIQVGFHIYRRYNLIKFLENVGFSDIEKRKKLIRAINSYKGYGRNEIKMMILNELKNGPLRTKELSVIVKRDRKVIWKNLHKLKRENLVEKILISKRGPVENAIWALKKNINSDSKK